MSDDSPQGPYQRDELIAALGGPERLEKYRAFMAGFNVGLEFEQSDRGRDMDEDEFIEWLVEMYHARVENDE